MEKQHGPITKLSGRPLHARSGISFLFAVIMPTVPVPLVIAYAQPGNVRVTLLRADVLGVTETGWQ
jgi:hypothetical protein